MCVASRFVVKGNTPAIPIHNIGAVQTEAHAAVVTPIAAGSGHAPRTSRAASSSIDDLQAHAAKRHYSNCLRGPHLGTCLTPHDALVVAALPLRSYLPGSPKVLSFAKNFD
ncbi:MAG: hypothetical protein WA324_18415 [Bryobacteraceae bacterium]